MVLDVSNHYKLTQSFVKEIEMQTKIKVLFIPGNHDFWSMDTANSRMIDSTKELEGIGSYQRPENKSLLR